MVEVVERLPGHPEPLLIGGGDEGELRDGSGTGTKTNDLPIDFARSSAISSAVSGRGSVRWYVFPTAPSHVERRAIASRT